MQKILNSPRKYQAESPGAEKLQDPSSSVSARKVGEVQSLHAAIVYMDVGIGLWPSFARDIGWLSTATNRQPVDGAPAGPYIAGAFRRGRSKG